MVAHTFSPSEPMIFIGVTYRSRNDPKTAASAKSTPAWVDSSQSWVPEHTAQPAGSSPAWRVSFAGDSVDLSLFQVSQLISASFRLLDLSPYSLQLGSSKNHSPQSFLFLSLGGRSLLNLVNFRDFLKLFLALYFLS